MMATTTTSRATSRRLYHHHPGTLPCCHGRRVAAVVPLWWWWWWWWAVVFLSSTQDYYYCYTTAAAAAALQETDRHSGSGNTNHSSSSRSSSNTTPHSVNAATAATCLLSDDGRYEVCSPAHFYRRYPDAYYDLQHYHDMTSCRDRLGPETCRELAKNYGCMRYFGATRTGATTTSGATDGTSNGATTTTTTSIRQKVTPVENMRRQCRQTCLLCNDTEVTYQGLVEASLGEEFHLRRLFNIPGADQVLMGHARLDTYRHFQQVETYMYETVYTKPHYVSRHVGLVCQNKSPLCTFWAAVGECERNPSFMEENCAPSCFACEKFLLHEYQCINWDYFQPQQQQAQQQKEQEQQEQLLLRQRAPRGT